MRDKLKLYKFVEQLRAKETGQIEEQMKTLVEEFTPQNITAMFFYQMQTKKVFDNSIGTEIHKHKKDRSLE